MHLQIYHVTAKISQIITAISIIFAISHVKHQFYPFHTLPDVPEIKFRRRKKYHENLGLHYGRDLDFILNLKKNYSKSRLQ